MPEPAVFHRVIVRAPSEHTTSGARMITPPADAFDPLHLRITPIAQVQAGDTLIGTVSPHYDTLLNPLDRAQWVSYFSHTSKPQQQDARPFDPQHCHWCTHNAHVLGVGAGSGHWTVDGCTTYRPDSLLLVVPRDLATP
ncbi:hypothetical protein ACTWJ9_33120 (plasmid) [Streptomyces sp. GDS52]|uniref:hypothetical protein n=1 Tax=Streptomyces sp. GDS52 TaxID=3406419 RepID=UPI003FD455BB